MDPFGVELGKTLGQLVGEYRTTFAWVALIWHLSTLAVMNLVFRYGNRYRRVFAELGGSLEGVPCPMLINNRSAQESMRS